MVSRLFRDLFPVFLRPKYYQQRPGEQSLPGPFYRIDTIFTADYNSLGDVFMLIHRIRHNFPITSEYNISRTGLDCYCFFHFSAPTNIELDGQLIHTRPNACVLYSPGQHRRVINEQPSLMNWAHMNTDIAALLEKYGIPLNSVFYPGDAAFIPAVFRQIEIEYFSGEAHAERLIDGYVELFLIKLSRCLQHGSKLPRIKKEEQLKIFQLRQSVLSQPEKRWSVEEMAKLVNLSPSRFHSVYKTLFGTTPIRDVVESKMDYAKTLLLSDEFTSIPDVAERLKYQSPYYFITQFKAVTGASPGAYRRKNRRDL